MELLTAAVIGVGAMGRHHARVYAEIPDVELVAICDSYYARAIYVAEEYGCQPYDSYMLMLYEQQPDLVTVAVPTSGHYDIAHAVLSHGINVMVEKPIASTPADAKALVETARLHDVVLAVGHIERCNPIVSEVKRRLDAGELGRVYRISTRRVGPSPVRIRDVGVTIDLGAHDLDVMRYLLHSEPVAYHAELQRAKHGSYEDAVTALIRFDCGTIGVLEADWLSTAKQRVFTVTGECGVIVADYITQRGTFHRSPDDEEVIAVPHSEPLRLELEAFAGAVRGEGRVAATGEDGLAALTMAQAILEA